MATSDDEAPHGYIELRSGVSSTTGKGFVGMWLDGERQIGQLSIEDCRVFAKGAFEAAEAAESDALVFGLLRDFGMEDRVIGQFLIRMRDRRDALDEQA